MLLKNVKKIGVLRANGLGDFIFSLPALQALRETYPKAEIVLLAKKWHKDFLEKRPSPINRVIILPKIAGVGEGNDFPTNVQELELFLTKIRHEKFDIGIQLHGGGKFSNPFIKNTGARSTVGLQTPDASPLDKNLPYIYYQNEYLRYLEVVGLLDAKTKNIYPSLTVVPQDIREATTVFQEYKTPFIILHPGASDLRRRWGSSGFAKIGDFLSEIGFTIVVTGSDYEEFLVKDVIQQMHHPAINLSGTFSLSGLTGIISLASLVMSNDTGPFHLAYALHTPAIGLFWCGNMINGAPLTRSTTRLLTSWITHCPLCNANFSSIFPFESQENCTHKTSFISEISIDEVKQTIQSMIEEKVIASNRKPSIYFRQKNTAY